MKKLFAFLLVSTILIATFLIDSGCANIVPPAGGPRDSLPPVLLRATPEDSSRNFGGNRLTFTFDEYIQVDNFSQNVLISPIPRTAPTETHRLNTLFVRLRDSLEPNTTYTINFGDAVKDVNEGNTLKDFNYVFSTGPFIDSLTFRGNVLLAETGKVDSTLIVILHTRARDSAVVYERPRYMTKLDSRGNFLFRNLPPDTFYVYALKDDTRSMRYQTNRQLFAFADSPVVVQSNTPPEQLYAYVESKTAGTTTTGTQPNVRDRRLKFQTSINNGRQDLLRRFNFSFERPLRNFDSSKIRLTTDTLFTPVNSPYSWTIDSTRKIVTLNLNLAENTIYNLALEKDFATDTLGQQLLRGDTLSFRTLANTDYGQVSIRFRGLDLSKNPVLQFVQNEEVVFSAPLQHPSFSRSLFVPGEYELRILHDANRNGVWDPGKFFGERRQPEIVKPIDRRINVKQDWRNEFEIQLANGG